MNYDTIKKLIINTVEEYKHSLGSDFRLVLKEINQLDDISVNDNFERNKAEFFFSIRKGKEKYKISTFVNKSFLEYDESCINDESLGKTIKVSVLAFWEASGKMKELYEYYIELSEESDIPIIKNNESHDVFSSNCEVLRDKLIPSCDIVSFFDILLLSLFRSAIPQLVKQLDWDKKIPLRSSLLEHIASVECFNSPDENSTDSEVEEHMKKRVAKNTKNSINF